MKCKKIQDIIITDYIDNELDGKARAVIHCHLAACKACREFLGSLTAVVKPFRDAEPSSPPDFLWGKIKAGLEREIAPGDYIGLKDILSIFRPQWVSAAAMAAMLAFTLLSGIFLTSEVLNKQFAKNIEIADTLELGAFSDIPGEQAKLAYSKIIGG